MCDRGRTITHMQIPRFHTQVWYKYTDCTLWIKITTIATLVMVQGNLNTPNYNLYHSVCSVFITQVLSIGSGNLACVRLLCVCVRACINPECFRRKTPSLGQSRITKFGQNMQTPWLRFLLFSGLIDLDFPCQIQLGNPNLPNIDLVHAVTQIMIPQFGPKMHITLFSCTLRREYPAVRNRYSRLLFTSEDRLYANLHVREQSTNMTSPC